jgi:hypothetical protein
VVIHGTRWQESEKIAVSNCQFQADNNQKLGSEWSIGKSPVGAVTVTKSFHLGHSRLLALFRSRPPATWTCLRACSFIESNSAYTLPPPPPVPRRSACERFQRPGGRDPDPHPRRSPPPCVLSRPRFRDSATGGKRSQL